MPEGRRKRMIALGLILAAAGTGAYWLSRPERTPPVVGVVRSTEVRIAPEVAGQLATIKVHKGDRVRAGGVVAELSAIELTAAVEQARAALAAATANRNNVYAGVRAEQIASLAAEIARRPRRHGSLAPPRRRRALMPRRSSPGQALVARRHRGPSGR